MAKRGEQDPRLLTEVELELMQILWDRGPSTVREVQAALPPERDLAYTTVSTVLRILEQKGQVTSQRDGRTHIYHPALSRQVYSRLAVSDLVSRVFDGDASGLVAHLLESEGLTKDELARVRALIDPKLG